MQLSVPAIAGQPEELLSLFWKDKRRGEAGFSRDLSWGKAKGCLN